MSKISKNHSQSNPKTEILIHKDLIIKKRRNAVLWIWFIFNAFMLIVISIKNGIPGLTEKAPSWDVIYIKNETYKDDHKITKKGKPGKRPIIKKGKNSVIFNDYVLLQQKPDKAPVKTRNFIPSGKITPVNVIENTPGEVGGVKWYKIEYQGKWQGIDKNTGWVPEYGMVKSTERRKKIIRIRKSEIRLRGYTTGMDFRGKWIKQKGKAMLLANIDLSYLLINVAGTTRSFQLHRMRLHKKNLYRLISYKGSTFLIYFENNRVLKLIQANLHGNKAGIHENKILGVYERKINVIKE